MQNNNKLGIGLFLVFGWMGANYALFGWNMRGNATPENELTYLFVTLALSFLTPLMVYGIGKLWAYLAKKGY